MATESRAILITGAGAGIGAAVTQALVERGITVYAGVRGEPPTERPGVIPVALDVTRPDSIAAAAQGIADRQRGQGLHAVINNAGIIVQGPLELVPESEWIRQFDVNVYGPIRVMQAFLPQLRQGRGRIINISAPTATLALAFAAPISASKAALAAVSDAARLELAPWQIPVVQVVPGGSETEIFAKADQAAKDALAVADPASVDMYQSALNAVAVASAKQRLDPVKTVVRAIVTAALSTKPKTHYVAGNARIFAILEKLPTGVRDRMIARALGLSAVTPAR